LAFEFDNHNHAGISNMFLSLHCKFPTNQPTNQPKISMKTLNAMDLNNRQQTMQSVIHHAQG
jgi:hypothetical protein